MRTPKPEERARKEIDRQLVAGGWIIQDRSAANIQAGAQGLGRLAIGVGAAVSPLAKEILDGDGTHWGFGAADYRQEP